MFFHRNKALDAKSFRGPELRPSAKTFELDPL